ncbi:helix-turn-helix domain-containing protein [Sphingomonas sp. 66-10]|uniref:helix-turn-helix domain-containing protein n=1 Tax=Sphingomonas sp. 66-10 TaxID=1895848 RepID=UPI00257D2797|nr:helix-turn-helix domain-containing protein [Sphingomonas sp. 66-10]
MRRSNRTTPRRLLEDQLFGFGDGAASNALEVYIHRLRRKIESQGGVSIRTVRGIGYMLVAK